ncbi:MAG: AAA family ATPase [Sedimentisphaerales bacterium]|nr:AAA family ATPase [Sedimentisphaerales bacterium]MBN2841732.1 AAA family ATPase [Sedimentisphaerales bacterium]
MLNKITIKNFRAITDLTLDKLGQVNLLFGENNCGKTSVLEAIFCFAAKDALTPLQTYYFRHFLNDLEGNESISPIVIKYIFNNIDIDKTIELTGVNKDEIECLKISCDKLSVGIANSTKDVSPVSKSGIGVKGISLECSKNGVNICTASGSFDERGLYHYDFLEKREEITTSFVNHITQERIFEKFQDIQKRKETGRLIELIKAIDDNIVDIRLDDKGKLLVENRNITELVPIGLMGDGVAKALSIAIAILSDPGVNIILIDEIENGLHHKSQEIVWKAIIQWAKEYNIQFFITTHSYEMIERLTGLLGDDESGLLRAYRLERESDNFRVVDFSTAELSRIIEDRWEIR